MKTPRFNTKEINLFVFDTYENFEKSKVFLGEEGSTFKSIICVENANQFENRFNLLNSDEYVFLVVHVFYTGQILGIKRFVGSGILKRYPKLEIMYISEGDSTKIKHDMVDAGIPTAEIYKYWQVQENLQEGKSRVYTKKEIIELSKGVGAIHHSSMEEGSNNYPQIDYGIITALYQDEFQELEKIFDFPEDRQIRTATKVYHRGYLKSNPEVEVVAAVPNASGMVDSSIIATQMLEYFNPRYLLMSGVCGGSKGYNIGDIIVAKQVYTFQKGKLSDIKRKNEEGELEVIDLYDKNGEIVDYNHLYDKDGNQVGLSVEKFEIEQDAMININSVLEDLLRIKLDSLKEKINKLIAQHSFLSQKEIKIEIEPIACSTMVINKEGYFEDTIKSVNRKTAAVEMESYGVARACHFANGGDTIPIIFKSVMDNTVNKSDFIDGINYKKFAAFTSAQFMKLLFDEKIIWPIHNRNQRV